MPIPWDKRVEFFHSGPDLNVARFSLTLRDAVTHFLSLPEDDQQLCGIGVQEAILVHIGDRPAALGFLQPYAIRRLSRDPSFEPS